ncbi:hypothetical protein D3C72_1305430 [compost metagenome]
MLHQLQVGDALLDQADRIVDLALTDALLRIFAALPQQLLGLQLGQALLAGGGIQAQGVTLFADDVVHAVEIAHPLAHQRLLRADVAEQLFDLRIGIAELLHQFALGGAQAIDQATDHRHFRALRKTIQLELARDAHHFAELLAVGVEVTIAYLVQQLAGEGRRPCGGFTAEHLQIAWAQVFQLVADFGDARQVVADQAEGLQRAVIKFRGGRGGGHERAGVLAVLGHRAVSLRWISGSGGRLRAV